MTSLPMRDQVEDHLLTPENSALLIIDFQPLQVASVASMDRGELVRNIVSLAKAAKLYGMPIVLSTVNVKTGVNQPTIHQLAEVLGENRSVRPNHHQRLGRQGVPRCGQSNRPQKACNCRTVVGSVPHLPSPRCPQRRLRGLSRGGCSRRDLRRGAPRRAVAHSTGRCPTHELGPGRMRAAEGLGAAGDHEGRLRHRFPGLGMVGSLTEELGIRRYKGRFPLMTW